MKKNAFYIALLFILMPLGLFVQSELNPTRILFLWASYGVNFALATIALFLLGWGMHHKKENLAILYLITVALKLAVYFLYFHPKFESHILPCLIFEFLVIVLRYNFLL